MSTQYAGTAEFLLVESLDTWLAVPMDDIVEVCDFESYRELPHTKPCVLGLVLFRDLIIPLATVNEVARETPGPDIQCDKMVVLGNRQRPIVAVPVNTIAEVFSLDDTDLEFQKATGQHPWDGVFKDEDGRSINAVSLKSFGCYLNLAL